MAETHPLDMKFFTKCAKPLIMQLSAPKERSLAAAWLKWLIEDSTSSQSLKNDYLKFLIHSLQLKKLRRPFLTHPKTFQTLPEFPQDLKLPDRGRERRSESYSTDFSGDLRTYVAYQEMENLGVHCYYAFSDNPFPTWRSFDPDVLPAGSTPNPAGLAAARLQDDGSDGLKVLDKDLEEKKRDFAEKLEKRIRNEERKKAKLVVAAPLGTARPEQDDRLAPSWGSNLIQVADLAENRDE